MLADLLASAQRIALDSSPATAAAASDATERESGGAAGMAHARLDQFRSTVQRIRFSDLGLTCTLETLKRNATGPLSVQFVDVLDHAALSVSLIIFPPGSSIPLHDHPGMHVFTKVLVGQLDIQMLDVDQPLPCAAIPVGTSVGVSHRRTVTLRAGEFCELTPVIGNIHGVACTGHETAVMLDVMLPPYPSDDACHYFKATDSGAQLCVINEALAWGFDDASVAPEASSAKKQGKKGKRKSGGGARGSS